MKLPVIRHLQRNASAEAMQHAIEVLEILSEAPSVKDEELDVIGETISNLCGAVEVKQWIAGGMEEKDALNGFMKKVMGSIDK